MHTYICTCTYTGIQTYILAMRLYFLFCVCIFFFSGETHRHVQGTIIEEHIPCLFRTHELRHRSSVFKSILRLPACAKTVLQWVFQNPFARANTTPAAVLS